MGSSSATIERPATPSPVAPTTSSRKKVSWHRNRRIALFAKLGLPGVIMYAVAVLAPLGLAITFSLENYNLLNGIGTFVGVSNYVDVLTDPEFWGAFSFTLVLTAGCVIIANGAGMILAVILNKKRRFFNVLRSITFVPSVLAGVVIAYIWSTILTDSGTLNSLLHNLGLDALQTSWLGSQLGAQVSVIIVTVWPSIGFGTVIYLAGLQSVPTELLEAASVDGASPWRTFRSITWPLLRPSLFVTTTMMVIGGFKSYDISVVLTGGGPSGATDTPAFQILRHGFNENRAGYANAEAVVVLAILVIISVIGVAISNRGDRSA